MATITFPFAPSGVTFFSQTFDAQAGGTPWSPADCAVGSGVQVESAGNHGGIGSAPDLDAFDLSTLGSIAGTITAAIITFAHNGTYSTVGPGTLYDLTNFGDTHTEAEGASWSGSGTFDASVHFTEPPSGPFVGASFMENLPTYPWYNAFGAFGSIENGVTIGYQITVLSIEFTYTPSGAVVTDVDPTHGDAAGGTVVNLTGTGFTGATAVLFGATASSSFTVNSDTSIVCVSPPHAYGETTVTVTT